MSDIERREIDAFAKKRRDLRRVPKVKGIGDMKAHFLKKFTHFLRETNVDCKCNRGQKLLEIKDKRTGEWKRYKECGQCNIERETAKYNRVQQFKMEAYRIKKKTKKEKGTAR